MAIRRQLLIGILREAKALLSRPENDFSWSSWKDVDDCLQGLDSLITRLQSEAPPLRFEMVVLFAPTGPIQEVSISSGWGDEFLALADRFDAAIEGY